MIIDRAAWCVFQFGFIAVQRCDDGWDYTIYDMDYKEVDGGQIDLPEISHVDCRKMITDDAGVSDRLCIDVDYDDLMEEVEANNL